MAKIFVIAGNAAEARQWIKSDLEKRTMAGETTLSMSEYVYVDGPMYIRGYGDPHGVFVGTWRYRADMEDIFQALLSCHSVSTTSHRKINQLWGEWKTTTVRPTPKLTKVPGGWINEQMAIDHAGKQMAKAIDAEALAIAINGGNMTQRKEDYTVSYDALFPTLITAVQQLKKEMDELKSQKG